MLGTLFIGQNHISLASVDSTNSFAKDLLTKEHPPEGTIISATTQLKGRGQAGNTWAAEGGKNLTVSYILYPNFLEAAQQFYLNMAISLAVKDCCEEQTGGEFSIKWPNDIYYGDRKVAGILIENQLQGSQPAYDAVVKTREIHPGESNGLVIGNVPNPPIRRQNRDPKLVPLHRFGGSVAKGHRRFVDIGDVILPDLHFAGKKVHPVFKIIFGLG